MAQEIPFPDAASPAEAHESPFLSPERLDVYRLAIEFQKTAAGIRSRRHVGVTLRDQLDRASVSIVLCIAEGAGRGTARDKAHFFTIARGARPSAARSSTSSWPATCCPQSNIDTAEAV